MTQNVRHEHDLREKAAAGSTGQALAPVQRSGQDIGLSRPFGYGSFYRAIPLPEGADVEKTKAHVRNGVLEIRVPASQRGHNSASS